MNKIIFVPLFFVMLSCAYAHAGIGSQFDIDSYVMSAEQKIKDDISKTSVQLPQSPKSILKKQKYTLSKEENSWGALVLALLECLQK